MLFYYLLCVHSCEANFCYFGHTKKWDDFTQIEITIVYQRAENVIFPPKQSSTPFVFYLHEAKRGFIFQCLYR